MRIGVLALQGDVAEHAAVLEKLGADAVLVRTSKELEGVDGLILPGGESTTLMKLMERCSLDLAIKRKVRNGMPIFGTCAGLILLAKQIVGNNQPTLGLMDVAVKRNAYGRQVESFEADVDSTIVKRPLKVHFIRAPMIDSVENGVDILAHYEDKPVLVRQKHLLGASFHPELSKETALHRYFLGMIRNR